MFLVGIWLPFVVWVLLLHFEDCSGCIVVVMITG